MGVAGGGRQGVRGGRRGRGALAKTPARARCTRGRAGIWAPRADARGRTRDGGARGGRGGRRDAVRTRPSHRSAYRVRDLDVGVGLVRLARGRARCRRCSPCRIGFRDSPKATAPPRRNPEPAAANPGAKRPGRGARAERGTSDERDVRARAPANGGRGGKRGEEDRASDVLRFKTRREPRECGAVGGTTTGRRAPRATNVFFQRVNSLIKTTRRTGASRLSPVGDDDLPRRQRGTTFLPLRYPPRPRTPPARDLPREARPPAFRRP